MRSFLLLIICLVALPAFAGDDQADSVKMTPAEFEKKIEAGAALLRGKPQLTAEDAISLVRLSNTIFLSGRALTDKEKEFGKLMSRPESVERLKASLGEAVINKGMGYYFPKHDLHWGGAGGNIRNRDRYVVTDEKK